MKRPIILCLLALSLGMSACQQAGESSSKEEGKENAAVTDAVTDAGTETAGQGAMTQADIDKLAGQKKYVLVDYNAKWCGPCKKMMPILNGLANKRKDSLLLVKVDADENGALMQQKQIASIPYLELYKDGKLVWTYTGMISEEGLVADAGL